MAVMDYQQLLDTVINPEITETVFKKDYDEFSSLFTNDGMVTGGKTIVDTLRTAEDSTARNYTRDDVDPEGGSFTTVDASWNKTYQEVAFEVHNIDQSEQGAGGIAQIQDALMDAAKVAMDDMKQLWWNNLNTRLRADIDSTATYSDGALSRSTYPTLASYEEATDTAITIDLARTMMQSTRINKNSGPKSNFIILMESAVYNKFEPLAAALHTWNVTGQKGMPIAAGYQPLGSFEGSDVYSPQGMTTGDVFYVRPQDVMIRNHRSLEMKQVESGRDSVKVIMRAGVTPRVKNPGFQGKMTSKD